MIYGVALYFLAISNAFSPEEFLISGSPPNASTVLIVLAYSFINAM
jgi:hypothetical protein